MDQYEASQYNTDLEIRMHSHVYIMNAIMPGILNIN
jgi:hypothetical protein